MHSKNPLNRRALLTGIGATATAAVLAPAGTARAADLDLPKGQRRGSVVGREAGVAIHEVVGQDGRVVGYALPASEMEMVRNAAKQIQTESDKITAADGTGKDVGTDAETTGFWETTQCAAAIAWFAAQTVFPSVKLARVAWKLAQVLRKYGARKLAKVFTRWRSTKGRGVEQDIKDVALALTGVGALSVCFN